MPNIYLIGMMGSGKSVTGKRLANKLGYGFTDLDERVQQAAGKTISQIFSEQGEASFRDLESRVLKDAAAVEARVVATGGGSILRRANVELMKATGKIIFLQTSPEVLWRRVRDKKDRPLLKDGKPEEKLLEIYAYRQPIYEGACDAKVNTDGKTAQTVADEINEILRQIA